MEGRKNKAYYNTGTYGVPVWSPIPRISVVKRPQKRGTSEYDYRGAENKKTATGKKAYSVSFKYETKRLPGATDTVLAALQDSFDNETVLDMAFTDQGKVKIRNAIHERDPRPLQADIETPYSHLSRAYLRHLFKAKEMLGPILLSLHNLTYYQQLMQKAREAIANDCFLDFHQQHMSGWHPTSSR